VRSLVWERVLRVGCSLETNVMDFVLEDSICGDCSSAKSSINCLERETLLLLEFCIILVLLAFSFAKRFEFACSTEK
jgi:hypothetical protein